jgi:phosphoribosyl 1,2-cyclic phosphodiesterase
MNWLEPLLVSVFIAGIEFLVAGALEIRLALSRGRRLRSRVLARMADNAFGQSTTPTRDSVVLVVAVAVYQLFPLSRERLFGGNQPPDHISGFGVIAAELVLGVLLWIGTSVDRSDKIARTTDRLDLRRDGSPVERDRERRRLAIRQRRPRHRQ